MAFEQGLLENHKIAREMERLIKERRTIRRFGTKPLSEDIVSGMIQTAMQSVEVEATCRFILVASDAGKEKIASLVVGAYEEQPLYKLMPKKMSQALAKQIVQTPLILTVILKEQEGQRDFSAVCAMLQSLSLLAWEQGIGLVWRTDEFMQSEPFEHEMGLQEGEKIVGTLYLGYYEKVPKGKKRTPALEKLVTLS